MTPIISQCLLCRHLHPHEQSELENLEAELVDRCAAFPKEIPWVVMVNRMDHRQPIDGDQGIRWEPRTPGDQHPGTGIVSTFTPGRAR